MSSSDRLIGSREFPNLTQNNHEEESPVDPDYNCIAWAAGDQKQWWWPDRYGQAFWPQSVSREATVESFMLAFGTLGYSVVADGQFQPGTEKIALYAISDIPTHAARQLPGGRWASKLGKSVDIIHELEALDGPFYGQPVCFLGRENSSLT